MINKELFLGKTENVKAREVSIEEMRGKTVAEQFELLEVCGYTRGIQNPFVDLSLSEWQLILAADGEGHVKDPYIDILSVEKFTTPFVLYNENGEALDEISYIRCYYWGSDPARLVAEYWLKGGDPETVLTMPLSGGQTLGGLTIFSDDPADYILTGHDVKCIEEMLGFYFRDITRITELPNGRYVLATGLWDNGTWTGFPVCGDGNVEQYRAALTKYLFTGIDCGAEYEAGKDDGMTFASREAAKEWAKHLGIRLAEETA